MGRAQQDRGGGVCVWRGHYTGVDWGGGADSRASERKLGSDLSVEKELWRKWFETSPLITKGGGV